MCPCIGMGCTLELEVDASGFGFFDGSITSNANRATMSITITSIPSGLGCPVVSSYMKLRIPRIAEPRYGTGTMPWYTPTTYELDMIVSAVPHLASHDPEATLLSRYLAQE